MVFNIRQRQSEAVSKMLNLNAGPLTPGAAATGAAGGRDGAGELYKVLVMDRFCRDIIAPLLRLNELRRHGVTLHLVLENERQPIPDVPAIYFVQPTAANVDRIAADAAHGLYDALHLNFSSSLPGRLLESLAAGAVKGGAATRIQKVFDQYLAFVALEQNLFSLGLPNAYVELNDPAAQDSQIEAAVVSIVDGLFSALVTLGVVPIIRCPRGGVAEHVAGMLDAKLRDHLRQRANMFAEATPALGATLQRPLLALFDRNFDLAAGLQHGWSYKPLVQDVLGLKLNRVTLQGEAGPSNPLAGGGAAKKSYDVDEKDFFWETCGSYPFPKVAEEVEAQLQKYKAAVEEINRQAATGGDEAADQDEVLKRHTASLMSAVSSLPELQEKKKVVDKHTNLATALLSAIKARALDQFHGMEEEMLSGKADLPGLLRLLSGPKGTADDKLRAALLYVLAAQALPPEAELSQLEEALKAAGADPAAFAYVVRLRRNGLVGSATASRPAEGYAAAAGGGQAAGNILDWADKTFGQVTKSVRTLLAATRQAPVTTALEALMDGRQGAPEFETYAVFDPKAPAGRPGPERAKGPFREAIVFMIGGGNYLEREVLASWAGRSQPSRSVVYGATELLSGDEFARQLAELGRRSV